MTTEKQPFEDVSPIKKDDFPASNVSLLEGKFSNYNPSPEKPSKVFVTKFLEEATPKIY